MASSLTGLNRSLGLGLSSEDQELLFKAANFVQVKETFSLFLVTSLLLVAFLLLLVRHLFLLASCY